MRRLIDPIELKKSIVVSNIIGDGKTLEELIDEQPDAQPEWKTGEIAKDTSVPSTDCISRQAAIDLLKQMRKDGDMIPWEGKDVFARIRKLPSAEPERKTGKWIYNSPVTMKCNQCGLVIKDWDWHRFKYCPNCCSDMRGGRE